MAKLESILPVPYREPNKWFKQELLQLKTGINEKHIERNDVIFH